MASACEVWARAERQFLRTELEWLNAGAKLISPSGEDVSANKREELETRLEHVNQLLERDEE